MKGVSVAAPKKYPGELRERAVRLYRESDPKPVIRRPAEQLGVHYEALQNWIRQAEADHGERHNRPTTAETEGLRQLSKEKRRTPPGQRNPQGSERIFRPGNGPGKEEVVKAAEAVKDRFGITPILKVLGVAVSTYYGWLAQERDPSPRRRADADLLDEIRQIHDRSGATYGALRVHATLRRRAAGVTQARRAAEAQSRTAGRVPAQSLAHRFDQAEPTRHPAPDLLNRDFTAAAPNRLWVADATRIPGNEGVFWLAAVRDASSNRIVGRHCSDRCDTGLILGALEYAIWTRNAHSGQVIHHSDRGSSDTSLRSGQRLVYLPSAPS
jgi:transposase-like protein